MTVDAPYGPVIAERYRRPRFRGALDGASASADGFNPLCGDRVRIELRLRDGRIEAARHRGDACAICVASADILLELIEGGATSEGIRITTDELRVRLGGEIAPSRLACVALPLNTLKEALGLGMEA